MDKNLLLLTLPLIVFSALLLWKAIASLVAAVKAAEIAVVSVTSGAEIVFNHAGEVILALRGRLGSRDFSHAKFALLNALGTEIPAKAVIMRSRTTNLSGETTLSLCRYQIPTPGPYRLNVSGVNAAEVSANSRIVFLKPIGLALLLHILLIVFSAIVLIGSCVVSGIIVASFR